MKISKLLLVLAASSLMMSCATVLRTDKTQVVKFNPEQENTLVFVNGEYIGMSPVEMEVDPSKDYEVTYLKKSYVGESFALKKGVLTRWLLADLACLPVTAIVPTVVDASTGAWNGIKTGNMPKSLRLWSDVEDPHECINSLFQIENLYFETGKATIKKGSEDDLNKLAAILNKHEDIKLFIHGHTDKTGDREFNIQLSKDRSESVKNYLVEKGVDPSRIKTDGHGPDMPLIEGDTEDAFKYNRRVEFQYSL